MIINGMSHPSWVCGLKRYETWLRLETFRVTPFVGVWIETLHLRPLCARAKVTPFVGVWIETLNNPLSKLDTESHPSWVCGLKLGGTRTDSEKALSHPSWVCGLKLDTDENDNLRLMSHPSWVCGLKLDVQRQIEQTNLGHTLRGCVD